MLQLSEPPCELITMWKYTTAATNRLHGRTPQEAMLTLSRRVCTSCMPMPSVSVWQCGKRISRDMITCVWVLPVACLIHCSYWAFSASLHHFQPSQWVAAWVLTVKSWGFHSPLHNTAIYLRWPHLPSDVTGYTIEPGTSKQMFPVDTETALWNKNIA